MSADTGRVKISRFCSDLDKQKQLLQETKILCVLEINWLGARDTPFSSSKTTCIISATSCWVLKSKGTPLMLDSLHFTAHKKLDGSTGLLEFFFMVVLRLMVHEESLSLQLAAGVHSLLFLASQIQKEHSIEDLLNFLIVFLISLLLKPSFLKQHKTDLEQYPLARTSTAKSSTYQPLDSLI